jgi:hypothetical protein
MDLYDYFDVNNIEHLKAYRYLQNNGSWPKDFFANLPFSIEIGPHWNTLIKSKLADAYVDLKLSEPA